MASQYRLHNSCKFLIMYHMIFVCKYRRNVLNPIRKDVLKTMVDISERHDFKIKTQEVDRNHIHLPIESTPKISPSQICRVLKQESTISLWRQHSNYLGRFYWKEHTLWSDGYFVCSISNASEKTIQNYIQKQRK